MKFTTLFRHFSVGISFALVYATHLNAEIEKVSVKWTPYQCDAGCVQNLDRQFRQIAGVADVTINMSAAQAEIRWRPNIPFSYTAIDTAMRMIGPSIDNRGLRLKVRGTIQHDARSVTLISTGDNSRFILLGPIVPSPTHYVEEESVWSHRPTPEARNEYLAAEDADQTVTVEGPLFQPEQAPPMYMIVEKKQFASSKSTGPED